MNKHITVDLSEFKSEAMKRAIEREREESYKKRMVAQAAELQQELRDAILKPYDGVKVRCDYSSIGTLRYSAEDFRYNRSKPLYQERVKDTLYVVQDRDRAIPEYDYGYKLTVEWNGSFQMRLHRLSKNSTSKDTTHWSFQPNDDFNQFAKQAARHLADMIGERLIVEDVLQAELANTFGGEVVSTK